MADPERIRSDLLARLRDTRIRLVLSAVSSWEISMKHALGRLALPESPERYVPSPMKRSRVEGLPVEHAHALRVASLERHHQDPFDRLLIAQAQLERLTILTADPLFGSYDVALERAVQ